MNRKAKEIGSYFDIAPENLKNVKNITTFMPFGDAMYLSTCRSAIDIVIKDIKTNDKIALLPGFTCHAVVEPFIKNGYKVIPYFITTGLFVNMKDLTRKIEEFHPKVILIHDYFGFDSNKELRSGYFRQLVIKNGITVINDQTQSMFSKYEPISGNYYLGSIRKWMGIPDGAFLLGYSGEINYKEDIELEDAKKKAMVYKNKFLFDNEGTKENVLENYRYAEKVLDSRNIPYAISETSKYLIDLYDLDDMKKKRQENGQTLLNAITENDKLLFPFNEICSDEVPFYIPIFVKEKRKELQSYLAKNNVFATVIWGCPNEFVDCIDSETRMIYERILCIPCDQRYSLDDMKYICDIINSFEW